MAMASEVSTGQDEVFRQFEQQSREQTAQACRPDSAAKNANCIFLGHEAMMLQRVIAAEGAEMSQASKVTEDTQASWNQLSDANALLR